ncbi:MAG TPA: glycosyltransferase family 4 protein, partial [Chloroflexia bacterium]|nr:glycosyltransferase family 4 protein [Chloroflexia bacterium]
VCCADSLGTGRRAVLQPSRPSEEQMRLAYCLRAVFPQHGYGGLERSGTDLMRHLLMQGVDIDLFTRPLPEGHPLRQDGFPGRLCVHALEYDKLPLKPNGIPARLTNYRAFVEAAGRRVRGLAREGLVQAIYAHGLFAWGVHRASEWGLPMVANPHGLEEFKTPDPLKRLAYAPMRAWVRAGCRAADRVIATDNSMKQEVARLLGLPVGRVVVVRNGIDLAVLRAYSSPLMMSELIMRYPVLGEAGRFRGISVGRMEGNKGFDVLLKALARATASLGEQWTWVLVGEGSLRPELQRLASELGIGDNVLFPGEVSDEELHNLYELVDVFAHPSLYEGSSLVTLEAMAHRLPVVASAVGGIPDKVEQGESGFLVEPGDVDALANKIGWMAASPDRLPTMGAAGAGIAASFDWPLIARQTAALLEGLVSERLACSTGVPPRA